MSPRAGEHHTAGMLKQSHLFHKKCQQAPQNTLSTPPLMNAPASIPLTAPASYQVEQVGEITPLLIQRLHEVFILSTAGTETPQVSVLIPLPCLHTFSPWLFKSLLQNWAASLVTNWEQSPAVPGLLVMVFPHEILAWSFFQQRSELRSPTATEILLLTMKWGASLKNSVPANMPFHMQLPSPPALLWDGEEVGIWPWMKDY